MRSRWLGTLSFDDGLAEQETRHEAIRQGREPEQVLHLEHESVYTIGRTRDQSSLGGLELLPHPVHVIGRGGQATYHGPGQLVSYPLVNLEHRGRDLHAYLRCLESALISTCRELGVPATRRDGLTGIWVEHRKLASIGVGVRRWVTLHGLAINITAESLEGFRWITPCGLEGVSMTAIEAEGGRNTIDQTPESFAHLLQPHLEREFDNLAEGSTTLDGARSRP